MINNEQKASMYNEGKSIINALNLVTFPNATIQFAFRKAIRALVNDANDSAYVPQTDEGAESYELLSTVIDDLNPIKKSDPILDEPDFTVDDDPLNNTDHLESD